MSTTAISDNNAQYFQAIVPGNTHYVAFTNTSADSLAFSAATTILELFATQDCWVLIKTSGSSATAAIPSASTMTDCFFCPGGIVRFVGLPKPAAGPYKLAVVRNTNSGSLYISEGR